MTTNHRQTAADRLWESIVPALGPIVLLLGFAVFLYAAIA